MYAHYYKKFYIPSFQKRNCFEVGLEHAGFMIHDFTMLNRLVVELHEQLLLYNKNNQLDFHSNRFHARVRNTTSLD